MKEFFKGLVQKAKDYLTGEAFKQMLIRRAEKMVIKYLRKLALQSTNKVDDRLVEAVVAAIEDRSYLTILRKRK